MPYRPLSEKLIRQGLKTRIVGREIVVVKTVGSTNDWLKAAAAEGAPEGLAVFAEEQTAGRGQAGRTWLAPRGCCLLGSVLLRPRFAADRLPSLTMLGACAAAAASIERTGLPIRLKWPNDLLGERGKVGGVLIEASLDGTKIDYAILGIGLNVNLPRAALASLPGADSLQAGLGHPIGRNPLARALLRALDERYAELRTGDAEAIFAEWRERLATIGKWVNLQRNGVSEGPFFALQVAPSGALILLRPDGTTFEVNAGDISVRPAP